MTVYEDVTNSADERIDFPEYVDGFRDLGFEQIGRVLDRSNLTPFGLSESKRAEAIAHAETPTPVLRSPNTPAFVEVSWHFGCPSIRMRTMLADGYLVETLRRWDHLPWNRPHDTINKLMLKNHAPLVDRSTRLVSSSACIELWAAHHEHVQELRRTRNAAPLPHRDIEEFLSLAEATHERDRDYWYETAERYPAGENRPRHRFPRRLLHLDGLDIFLLCLGVVCLAVYVLAIAFLGV